MIEVEANKAFSFAPEGHTIVSVKSGEKIMVTPENKAMLLKLKYCKAEKPKAKEPVSKVDKPKKPKGFFKKK